MKIYHNPRCGKSREAIQLLNEKKLDYEVRLYLKEGLTQKEIKEILDKLQMKPMDIIRQNEKEWKENFEGQKMSNTDLIKAIVAYPKLLQRPIIVKGGKAVIGRPIEQLKDFMH